MRNSVLLLYVIVLVHNLTTCYRHLSVLSGVVILTSLVCKYFIREYLMSCVDGSVDLFDRNSICNKKKERWCVIK